MSEYSEAETKAYQYGYKLGLEIGKTKQAQLTVEQYKTVIEQIVSERTAKLLRELLEMIPDTGSHALNERIKAALAPKQEKDL